LADAVLDAALSPSQVALDVPVIRSAYQNCVFQFTSKIFLRLSVALKSIPPSDGGS
jgi:hypothetical protein